LPREVADLRKEVETLALCMTDRPLSHVSWESTSRQLTSQPASVSDSLSGSLERSTIPWNPDFGGTGSALTTGLASFKFGHAHTNDNLQDQLLGRINTIVNRLGLGSATESPARGLRAQDKVRPLVRETRLSSNRARRSCHSVHQLARLRRSWGT